VPYPGTAPEPPPAKVETVPSGVTFSDAIVRKIEYKQVAGGISHHGPGIVEHGLGALPVKISVKTGTNESLHNGMVGIIVLGK